MVITCPTCQAVYDLSSTVPKGDAAVVICSACQTHLNIEPRGAFYLYRPKVTIRLAPHG